MIDFAELVQKTVRIYPFDIPSFQPQVHRLLKHREYVVAVDHAHWIANQAQFEISE